MSLMTFVNLEKYSNILEFTHNKLISYKQFINFIYSKYDYDKILNDLSMLKNQFCINILEPSKNDDESIFFNIFILLILI